MSHLTPNHSRGTDRERGFTLVELLVAMSLTLILLGIVFTLFDQMSYVSDMASAMGDTNQSLRACLNLMGRDLTTAGTGIPIGGVPLPGGTGSTTVFRPGYGACTFPTTTLSVITLGNAANCGGPTVNNQGTDQITLLSVDPTSLLYQYTLPYVSAAGDVIGINTSTNIASGVSQVNISDLIMITNATGSVFCMVTAVNTGANQFSCTNGSANDKMRINQTTAATGNVKSIFTTTGNNPTPAAVAYKVNLVSYYIDNSTATPKLMKQVNFATANPVAMNIFGMIYTYDLSDGTTIGQRWVTTPNTIRKVDVQLWGQSSQKLRKSRQYYTNYLLTSVTIRNLAYKNQY